MKTRASNRPHAEMSATRIENTVRDILRRERSQEPIPKVQSFREFLARSIAGFAAPLGGTDEERQKSDLAWDAHKAEHGLTFETR